MKRLIGQSGQILRFRMASSLKDCPVRVHLSGALVPTYQTSRRNLLVHKTLKIPIKHFFPCLMI